MAKARGGNVRGRAARPRKDGYRRPRRRWEVAREAGREAVGFHRPPAPVSTRKRVLGRGVAGFLAVVMAFGGGSAWAFAAAEFGWTGSQGELTAEVCKEEKAGRGPERLHCTGTFVPQDGSTVDAQAKMPWEDGSPGDKRAVQSAIMGNYVQRSVAQGAGDVAMGAGLLAVSAVSAFFALSRGVRGRVVRRLPDRVQAWYAREF